MFNNVNAKKRLTQVMVAFVIICMTLTGSFLLLDDSISRVAADERVVNLTAGSDANANGTSLKNAIAGVQSGETVTINVPAGNYTVSGKFGTVDAGETVTIALSSDAVVYWDYESYEASGLSVFSTSYTDNNYVNGKYCGLIENSGNLTIAGSGTIRIRQIESLEDGTRRDNLVQRVYTLVNKPGATLNLSGVTVESYLSYVQIEQKNYQQAFLYNAAIYNEGTVNTTATIKAGSMCAPSNYADASNNNNSYAYAFVYGIYGGTVNMTGGKILVDSYAGFIKTRPALSGDNGKHSHAYAAAIGIYSNDVKVLGDSTINVLTKNFRGKNDNTIQYDAWAKGMAHLFSVGVMHTSGVPVIGPSVDVISSYEKIGDTKRDVHVPGATNSGNWWGNLYSPSAGGDASWVAAPVLKVDKVQNNIGLHTSEQTYSSNFFGASTPYAVSGNADISRTAYKTAQAYYAGSDATATTAIVHGGSENEDKIKSTAIVNGVAGKTSATFDTTSNRTGAPGDYSPQASSLKNENQGSQYLVVYRFFETNGTVESVSVTPDAKLKNAANITVSDATSTNGIVPNNSAMIKYASGGELNNPNFYKFNGANYELIESSATSLTGRLNDIVIDNAGKATAKTPSKWSTSNVTTTPLKNNTGASVSNAKDYAIIIYLDYQKLNPATIKVVAANKDAGINTNTITTSFTVPYTGENLVPGKDFDFGIIDTTNKKVVTEDYNYKGETNSSKTEVGFSYTTDNVKWTPGLPKNVGTYTIRAEVDEDNVTNNRQGAVATITGTISEANVTISRTDGQIINGTYGSTYNELFDSFKSFTLKANGKNMPDGVSGKWSIRGVDLTATPNAGTHNDLTVVWTPSNSNYGTATYDVTLVVAKRDVTVKLGTAATTYGESTITSINPVYETLPAIDRDKVSTWLANTKFKVKSTGAASAETNFYAGLEVGEYTLMVDTFGGSTNSNYNFTIENGTLTIEKRAVKYTAVATNKVYDGKIDVVVTLTNPKNNYVADEFDPTINNVTGTMVNANAGTAKPVTVKTESVSLGHNATNYYLVIENATTLTVDVAKYTPSASEVSVVANITGGSIVYGEKNTIGDIGLTPVKEEIKGSWEWNKPSTKPTVGQSSYVATFKPNDSTNYNSINQDVNVTVTKAEVEVTVNPITVTYGEAAPALNAEYKGFVFGESLDNIDYVGNILTSTDYSIGSAVRTEPYTISVKLNNVAADNYTFVAKNSTIKVVPRTLTVTANNKTITYGDTAPIGGVDDVTVTGLYVNDNLSAVIKSISVTAQNYLPGAANGAAGGDYELNPSVVLNSGNYTVKAVKGKLTVEKAVLTVTPVYREIPYGSSVPTYSVAGVDYTIVGFKNNVGDSLSTVEITGDKPEFLTDYTNTSFVNSYPVTAVTTGMSAANYTFEGASSTIKVVKADPVIKTAPTATVVNSHPLADATFINTAVVVNEHSGVAVAGTFTFVDTSEVIAWAGANTTKECDVIFTPNDIYNYNTVASSVTVKVTVKSISGIPVIQGSAMEGKTLTVSLAAMDPNTASSYNYEWYVGGTVASRSSTYVVKTDDIGKTIYVVLTAVEANGFKGTATSVETDKVIKALLETTADQLKVTLPTGVVYDAKPHAGTVAIADGYNANYFGTPTLKYNGSDKAPTEAGTYVVTVDVSTPTEPAGGYTSNYYGPATGIAVGTITITRAPYTVTVLANDKFYDGNVTATAEIIPSAPIGSTKVSVAAGSTFEFDGADVGTKNIIANIALTGKDAGNYEVKVNPATAKILPRVIYFRAKGVDKFYDGSNSVAVSFEYDANENSKNNDWGYAPVDNIGTIYLVNGTAVAADVDAGNDIHLSSINGDPAGASKNNYEVRISNANSATVNINRAPVTVVSPVINGETYDAARTLKSFKLDAFNTADGYWVFNDTSIVPTVKQKTYAATFISTNDNYEEKTPGTITINLERAHVTLIAANKSVVYGSNAPTYTIKEEGFTGTDTLAMIGGNITIDSSYEPGAGIEQPYEIVIRQSLVSDNYVFETVNGVLIVTPRTLNVTATAKDKVYNGSSEIEVEFSKLTADSGVFANDLNKVSLSYSSVTGMAKSANAGTTTVTYAMPAITGAKSGNYQLNVTPKSGELTVVISKADVYGVEFPADATVEFGYDLTHVVFGEPGIGDGTFAYENASQIVPGDLGTYNNYKVIFTPTDSKNYNTQEAVVSLQVLECVLDYTVGVAGTPQSGQTLTVVATNLPAAALKYMTYQWYRIDADGNYTAIKGATEKSYLVTDEDVGFKLAVRTAVIEGSPFMYADGADTETIEDIKGFVGKTTSAIKEVSLTFWQKLMDWLYRILAILTGIQLGGGLLGD